MLLAGNGEGDGQQCVFLTEDGNSMIQSNTNQEGMIAIDDFGNSVGQIMPQQVCTNYKYWYMRIKKKF